MYNTIPTRKAKVVSSPNRLAFTSPRTRAVIYSRPLSRRCYLLTNRPTPVSETRHPPPSSRASRLHPTIRLWKHCLRGDNHGNIGKATHTTQIGPAHLPRRDRHTPIPKQKQQLPPPSRSPQTSFLHTSLQTPPLSQNNAPHSITKFFLSHN